MGGRRAATVCINSTTAAPEGGKGPYGNLERSRLALDRPCKLLPLTRLASQSKPCLDVSDLCPELAQNIGKQLLPVLRITDLVSPHVRADVVETGTEQRLPSASRSASLACALLFERTAPGQEIVALAIKHGGRGVR